MAGWRIRSVITGGFAPGGFSQEAVDADVKNVQSALAAVTKDSLDSRDIQTAIGADAVRRLQRGELVRYQGFQVELVTNRTFRHSAVRGAIVALYPNMELLNHIDDIHSENAVVVVPWTDDIHLWIDTWGPLDLSTKSDRPIVDIEDPEVREALDRLMHLSLVSHPNDERRVREAFRKLRQRSRAVNPTAIRGYIIRNSGYGTQAADKVAKIAGGQPSRANRRR